MSPSSPTPAAGCQRVLCFRGNYLPRRTGKVPFLLDWGSSILSPDTSLPRAGPKQPVVFIAMAMTSRALLEEVAPCLLFASSLFLLLLPSQLGIFMLAHWLPRGLEAAVGNRSRSPNMPSQTGRALAGSRPYPLSHRTSPHSGRGEASLPPLSQKSSQT